MARRSGDIASVAGVDAFQMAKALDAHCLGLAGDLFERTAQHVGGGNFGCRVVRIGGGMNRPALDTRFDRTGNFNRGSTQRSEEHTSELQSLMRISYAVFCLKKKKTIKKTKYRPQR